MTAQTIRHATPIVSRSFLLSTAATFLLLIAMIWVMVIMTQAREDITDLRQQQMVITQQVTAQATTIRMVSQAVCAVAPRTTPVPANVGARGIGGLAQGTVGEALPDKPHTGGPGTRTSDERGA